MTILIVAATENELTGFDSNRYPFVDVAYTGVGVPAVLLKLGLVLAQKKYDLIINVGIAGSFFKSIKIGEIVNIRHEIFADLGFENSKSFIPLSDTDFSKLQKTHFSNPNSFEFLESYRSVNAITVNTSSGNKKTIALRKEIFDADVESMEGAAVFYIGLEYNIPFIELRAISNYIEERAPENWNIPLAIKNLNIELDRFIRYFTNS